MIMAIASSLENETKSDSRPQGFWAWLAFNAATVGLYALPFALPGERILLLFGLGLFWIGVVAVFRPYRWLRLVSTAVAMLCFFPVRTGTLRLLLLCGLMVLWIAALIVFRQRRGVWRSLAAASGLIAGFLLLPGRTPNPTALREEYVHSLEAFQGTGYIWGGENGLGIDCSGLIRCARIDAELRVGLRTLNPGPVRQAARIWWQDCSARELGEGYRNRTLLLSTTPAINRLDHTLVQAGDIAVPESGVHVLAYLGDGNWIEADPMAGSVIIRHAPEAKKIAFQQPMKILRWRAEAP